MKFFHLADLHIGKQLHHYNLKEDQEFILNQIVECAKKEMPDAVLIAGDVYDRAMPSAEAVGLFDDFLTKLSLLSHKPEILIISGNHDSAQRLDFASSILEKHRVHIAGLPPAGQGEFMKQVQLKDAYGKVNFYLFPFIKPGYVRNIVGKTNNPISCAEAGDGLGTDETSGEQEEHVSLTYHEAVQDMIFREHINESERNVIISHQFYVNKNSKTEIERSESEIITVGNIDSVYADCLERFDYVALGHIHKAAAVGKEWIRYSGSPLAYSVSEAGQEKGIVVAELFEKGRKADIRTIPLVPLRKVRRIEGVLSEILKEEKSSDYVSILLKDEKELFDARQRLMEIFDHILEIRLDNAYIRDVYKEEDIILDEPDPMEIFRQFYQEILTDEMGGDQEKILKEILKEYDGK